MMMAHRVTSWWFLALVLVTISGRPARGHGNTPPYIAFWGPFEDSTAHCQRMLGLAGARCVDAILALPRDCEHCSVDALAAAQAAIIAEFEAQARSACDDEMSTALGFRGMEEAIADLHRTCTDEPLSASALIATAVGESASEPCRERVRATADMFLGVAAQVKRTTLDLIAERPLQPSQRLQRINRAASRLAKMRRRLDARLAQACSNPPAQSFLVLIELRADCVVDGAYYQSAYRCPR